VSGLKRALAQIALTQVGLFVFGPLHLKYNPLDWTDCDSPSLDFVVLAFVAARVSCILQHQRNSPCASATQPFDPTTTETIMAPGGPPGAGRGRGGKFKKFTRGGKRCQSSFLDSTSDSLSITGGKHFSKNLRPLDSDGNEIVEKDPNATSSEEEEDSSEEESSEEEDDKPAMTREERRAAAKAKKEAAIAKKKGVPQPGDMPSSSEEEESEDEAMPANPNHSKAARNQAKAAPVSVDEATEAVKDMSVGGKGKKPAAELSRREREAIQAQQAKERYQKMHEAGKTDEAKADLARLKLIREKRESEAARKQAEKEEREQAEKAKKAEIDAREAKRREAAMGPSKGKGKAKK